ncbi:MAG: hypothetical protein ABIQ11_07030 [Saprospiraceae bacterium]
MEEEDKQLPKTSLPEALDPEIGNSSYWETNPHFQNLRSINPTKQLENGMIDEEDKARIFGNWSGQLYRPAHTQELAEDLKPDVEEIPEKPKNKGKKKHKRIHSVTKAKETEPDWLQEESTAVEPENSVAAETREDLPVENISDVEVIPPDKPGKRVRKAVKVAEEEQKKTNPANRTLPPTPMESTLSPFTRWLKGLRGSEYVHPYEDDYALDQRVRGSKDGISETFADLLAAQGYRDQAIDMYKLLMAKYPEKSSFFAAKIEAL